MNRIWLGLVVSLAPLPLSADDISSTLGTHLAAGDLAEARKYLESELSANANSGEAQFGLAVVNLLSAVETLGQDQYQYGGLSGSVRTLPVLRIPVPKNPNPQPVTYEDVRRVFREFQSDLEAVEKQLAGIDTKTPDKLRIDLAAIKLDLNGDGEIGKGEDFPTVFRAVNRRRNPPPNLTIAFDAGDIPWLRGYCHFLMGFCDLVLAYDHQRLFDHCAQLVYPKPVPSTDFAVPLDLTRDRSDFFGSIADFVASIHLCVFPVKEPERMESARQHFLMMIETSRQSWELILAETDDDQEWLPNPNQTGALQMPVSQELIDGWQDVLDEIEAVLEGKKLIPFWRDYAVVAFGPSTKIPDQGRGVNLKKVCLEPREFDLVLTVQGTAVLPYVEEGPLSTGDTWRELRRVFRGQFFGFAMWFN